MLITTLFCSRPQPLFLKDFYKPCGAHTHPCDFIALSTYMMANEGKFEAWGR